MPKSMTGYGRAAAEAGDYAITIEIKSVNSRFLEVNCRMPRQIALMEDSLKKTVQKHLQRGKVDIFCNIEYKNGKRPPITIDKQAVLAYYNELKDLCDVCGVQEELSLERICSFPNVLQPQELAVDDALQQTVLDCLEQALALLIQLRENEGERLAQDLCRRIDIIEDLRERIALLAPKVAEDYRDKLCERMSRILQEIPIDEARIMQEAAIFADKADITEELTRLHSHCIQARQTMKESGTVGRTLDFIVQEMNREINTIGSKANFTDITKLVIDAKSELEKVREQVQNLE